MDDTISCCLFGFALVDQLKGQQVCLHNTEVRVECQDNCNWTAVSIGCMYCLCVLSVDRTGFLKVMSLKSNILFGPTITNVTVANIILLIIIIMYLWTFTIKNNIYTS